MLSLVRGKGEKGEGKKEGRKGKESERFGKTFRSEEEEEAGCYFIAMPYYRALPCKG